MDMCLFVATFEQIVACILITVGSSSKWSYLPNKAGMDQIRWRTWNISIIIKQNIILMSELAIYPQGGV